MEECKNRFLNIFKQLDVDSDGNIRIEDLLVGLKQLGIPYIPNHAQNLLSNANRPKNEKISYEEFVVFINDQEKKLLHLFNDLDRNKDGKIDEKELLFSLHKNDVCISEFEARSLVNDVKLFHNRKIRSNIGYKDASIDWEEWFNYHVLHPADDFHDLIRVWKHSTFIDIGETLTVPDDFTEEEKSTGMWWRQLAAGGGAGIVSRTTTAPLDRLKVVMQVHASSKTHIGVISGFKYLVAEGGFTSLWRGNGINIIKIAPETALKFLAYERVKAVILSGRKGDALEIKDRFAAGAIAGVLSQSLIYPLEVLKTKMAIRKTGQFSGIVDCTLKTYGHDGFLGFYKGYIPNAVGVIPYAGIDLAVYETLKLMYLKRYDNANPGVLLPLACGTISSTCGQLSSYPLSVIRTKMQVSSMIKSDIPSGFLAVGLVIVRQEGFFGLYKGILPNFLKVVPSVSIGYVVYEKLKQYLGVKSV